MLVPNQDGQLPPRGKLRCQVCSLASTGAYITFCCGYFLLTKEPCFGNPSAQRDPLAHHDPSHFVSNFSVQDPVKSNRCPQRKGPPGQLIKPKSTVQKRSFTRLNFIKESSPWAERNDQLAKLNSGVKSQLRTIISPPKRYSNECHSMAV